jgi:succinate-semialdehyde dehydrogenase/glutarate-semialdehyde dehydrogenase
VLTKEPPLQLIGGEAVPAASGRSFAVTDPATLEHLADVPNGDASDAAAAADAAARAFPAWAAASGRARGRFLFKLSEAMRRDDERLAAIITAEAGKPLKQALGEVRSAAAFVGWYAEEAKRANGTVVASADPNRRISVIRQPAGVAAAITPWNFPLGLLARKVAAALAAGCTVVAKPASETPLIALAFAELATRAGIPPGVLNVVTGDPEPIVGAWMDDRRIRRLSFTGSTAVGQHLAREAARTLKRASLELGGSAPYVVFDDADIDLAVEGLLLSKIRNAGQVCAAPNRIYVHRSIHDEFVTRVRAMVDAVGVGNGRDPQSAMGPLISESALRNVERLVHDARAAGAGVYTGGRWIGTPQTRRGWFMQPTIVTGVADDAELVVEEAFGPVLSIMPFASFGEAIARANDTRYGLGAYVFTRDLDRAQRAAEAIESGIVGINDPLPASVEAPFGGSKASGYGREGGAEGLAEFLEEKTISLQLRGER